jgi:hypothetical protein
MVFFEKSADFGNTFFTQKAIITSFKPQKNVDIIAD